MKRAIYAILLLLVLWGNKAQAKEMICKEVEIDPPIETTVYECVAPADGSRITAEQRKSVNAVVVSTMIFGMGRKR